MAAAKGVTLNHIARESSDVKRLATFYQQILGFEKLESPNFGEFEVIWLKLPSSSLTLHLIQRNPSNNLPESPYSAVSPVKDPKNLPRGHHVSFGISNFDDFVQSLQILGFVKIESPSFGEFEVIWLKLPSSSLTLRLIQRNPSNNLPESPSSAVSPVKDFKDLPRGHHVSFGVSNFDEFVQSLQEKEIETFVKTQPDGKTKQVFFFDPDGNGLEVGSW